MPLFHAIRRLWNEWLDAERSANRARRSAELAYPRLYGMQLEERQLLDAAPLVQLTAGGLLTVGAGAGANDGQADQFSITESGDESGSRIDVRVNGEAAGSFDKSAVSQIRVVGSSDADTLVLDPMAAPPGGILFEGAGNPTSVSDQLILQSPAVNDFSAPVHVQHVMASDGGSITINSEAVPAAFVEYVGVEQVTDRLEAESRSFDLAEEVSARMVGDTASSVARLESSSGVTIDFSIPTQSLAVTALGPSAAASSGDSAPDVDSDTARIRFEGDLSIAGGHISLDAGGSGLLEVAGNLSTTDSRSGEHGGSIHLLGDRVYVRDGAVIDASGEAGGGEILVGGGQTGADPNVRNARYTWLETGATLSASALGTGAGGRVIVWADVMAAVHGDIYAMGGIGGGDGGFVETSGLVDLVVWNAPNVSAPQGAAGVWLIDPLSITIVAGAANTAVTASSPFEPTAGGAQLSITTLRTALGGGATVIVQTAAGTGAGDITLATDLDLNGLNGASLTLLAHGNIILNARIFDSATGSVDRVNLTFDSNTDNSGGGDIQLNNATLSSGGGSITFSDPVIVGANVTIDSRTAANSGGVILFSGTVNADNSASNNRRLIVNAGDAAVTFSSSVGTGTGGALADLDVTGSTITLAGNVTVNDQGGLETTFVGDVVLAANVTITTVGATVSNSFRVTGSLRGDAGYTRRLDIFAGAGNVNFAANVDQLALFRIRTAADVSLQSVTTGGVITGINNTIHIGADSAVASLRLRGDLRTNGQVGDTGGIRLNSTNAIQLDALSVSGGSILLQTDGTTTTDGAITFVGTSTISSLTSGLDGLRINAGSNSLDLSSLSLNTLDHLVVTTASTQSVTLGALSIADGGGAGGESISVSSGTIGLTGNITALGNVMLTGIAELRGNISITTSGATTSGDVTITGLTRADNSTTNNRTLQVNAGAHDVAFAGDIGSGAQSALAGLNVTGAKITLSGSNVVVDDTTAVAATIALNGAVVLANSIAVDLDGSSGADNNLTITGSVNANDSDVFNQTLTINAGGGTVEIAGAVGQDAKGALADLDITAASIRLGGNIRVDDPGVDPAAATITFNGAVTLTANVDVDVDASTGVDNNVAFSQTVSGDLIANNRRLSIVAGGGDVVFSQAVDKLALFRINSADDVQLAAVTVHGTAVANTIDLGAVSALGSLTLRGDLRTDGSNNAGNVRIQASGDVSLDAPGASAGTIRFDTDATGSDGSVVFVGAATVRSATANLDGWTLVVGDNSLDLSSLSIQNLDHLSISTGAAESVVLGALALGEGDATAQIALAVTAGTIELSGSITTDSGEVLLDGGVVLSGDVTIDTTDAGTGADIEVIGTIRADDASAADRSLAMNAGTGDIRLQDSIGTGASGALAGLLLTAATIELGSAEIVVNDAGAAPSTILFDGEVLLMQSLRIDVDTDAAPFNHVRFTGEVNADSAANQRTLDIAAGGGTVVFEASIGTAVDGALADLDVTADTITFSGNVLITAAGGDGVDLLGDVLLAQDTTIDTRHTGSTGYDIRFAGRVDNASATRRALTVSAGDGEVALEGTVGLGANGPLADLDVTAQRIQLFDDVRVDGALSDGVVFTGAVELAGDVLINTASGAGADVTFTSTINADSAANQRALEVVAGGGTVVFGAGVGTAANGALADLDVTASTITFSGDVLIKATGGDGVELLGDVLLAQDTTLDTRHTGPTGYDVRFAGRIDNANATPRSLTVLAGNGEVALEGAVGLGVHGAIADLDVTAGLIRLFDEIQIDGDLSDGVVFTGAVALAGDVLIDTSTGAGADVAFTSTVDADLFGNQRQLTVLAGDGRVTFTGPVGSVASLSTLDVTAAEIALHDDVTVEDAGGTGVSFDGAVILFADIVINTNGATVDNAVRFEGTVDGDGGGTGRKLTIDSGTATTSILGEVGGNSPLADLDVTAATIVLGDRLRIDAAGGNGVTFNGDVLLAGNVSLDTDRATGGDYSVLFNGQVDADNASTNNRSLTINAGTAAVVFAGEIGTKIQGALQFLDVTADEIRLVGRVIADDAGGATTAFRGDLFLEGNVTIDVDRAASAVDNNVLFAGVVRADDSAVNDRRLTVVAGNGTATFQEAIGGGAVGQLANLDVTASTIFLASSVIVDDGPSGGVLALRGAVVLNGNVTLDTAGAATANNVLVTGAIQGDSAANNRQLTIIAGAGDVRLDGAASVLALFRIDSADDVVLNGVSTAGRTPPRTIDLGRVSSLGSLTLRGDLRTDAGTDAGDIYIDVTGAITLDAPGSGSIAFDTDAVGIDGSVVLAAGLNFVSATPFQDGIAFRVGASTLDLRSAVLSGLDHLIVQTDSAHDVILGSLSLGDGAGSGGLGALSITTRTAILTANIQTSSDPTQAGGDVLINADVRLEANVDIHTAAAGSAGDVTIRGSVNADNAAANDRVFRVLADGAAVRLANVGDATNGAVSQLIVRAGTTTLTGVLINADDANAASRQIDFQQGDVILANTMTMTLGASAQPGDKISFAALLNADGLANRELTLDAAGGQIFFFGSVGAAPNGALARLDATAAEIVVTAPVVNLSAGGNRTSVLRGLTVLTNNVQFITDGSSTTDNSLVFAGVVRADSSVLQSRILIIQAGNGSVTFEQDVGGGANGALAGLNVSARTIIFRGAMVNVDDATTGQLVLLNGNVVVANNGLLFDLDTTGTDNSLRITGEVNADDSSTFARRLNIQAGDGSVTLDGSLGAGANGALADLDIFASTIALGGSMIRVDDAAGDGVVTFGGAVRLANDVTIDTDAASGSDNSVVFQGTVNADDATTRNRRLDVQAGTASISFLGDIGAGTNGALAELDLTASLIQLLTSSVRIDDAGSRESNWAGAVSLGANTVTVDLDGTTAVDNSLTVTGAVIADNAIAFDRELVVLGGNGTVSLLGGVGLVGGFELAGLKVQAGLYRLGGQFLVDDGGGRSIEFLGNGQLAADVVFDIDGAVDNSLTFFGAGASIDSDSAATPRRLTIVADQGSVAFEAALGNNTPLAGLDVVSAQNLTLSRVTTMGNSGGNTIHLGSASPISGQLALTGDLRTNQGAAAGGIRIQASGPVIIEAAGAGTAGSIRLDTDLAGSTVDGAIIFVGGANFRSANPFEDGLALSAGSQSVDLANANLAQLDHLVVTTASDQTVTLGGVSVGDGAGSGVGAAIDVTTGVTRLRGNLVTNNETSGGAVVLRSAVELGGQIDILTNSNGLDGRVEILGNLRADDQVAFDRDLEVNSGDAETWFRGDVGSGSQGALAGLSVTAGTIRLAGANVIVNDATAGTTVLLAGDVSLENNVLFLTDSVTGIDNNVSFNRTVKSDNAALNNRRLTVEAGGGTVRFLGTVGVGGALADLDVAASATQLGGDLRIDDQGGNTVTFQGAVQLLGNIAIDVAGPPDNHLEFVGPLSTIDGDSAINSRGLSITAGQGNVTLGGAIGVNQRIGQLTIVSARDVVAQGAIQATGVSQLAGSGDSTFRGVVATSGPSGITLAADGLIDMQSDVTANGGGIVRLTQGRALRLAGNVLADGGFLENGAGTVSLTAGKSVSTTGDTLEFQSDIQLTGGGGIVQLDSTQGGQVAGNDITLRGSIDATSPAPNAESLTLNAGTTGDILFEGSLGGTATLGVLRINSAADVTFDETVTVAGILQFNGQAGKTTQFQDRVNITSNLGLFLETAGDIRLNGSLDNTGGGLVEFRNGGELTIAGDIVSTGFVRQSGTGGVAFLGNRSISTSGQAVDLFGPVSLQSTGATPSLTVNTAGGNIVMRSSVDSPTPGALRLDAGATGDIELRGAIGGVGVLREVAVVNTNDLLVSGTLRAGSFRQQAGTGNTSLTGSLETTGAGGIEVTTAGNIAVNRLLAQGNVPLTLAAGNDISIGANGEVFVTGNAPSTTLIINAGDDLLIDPTARLRVGTGANQAVASGVRPVITVTPVADPFGVSVNQQGETTVRVQVGTVGSDEQNVDLRIDWEKGQFSPLPGTVNDPDFVGGGRVYTFDYQYNGNPSPNPTDPIPILISAAFDPRIQLSNQGGTLLGTVQQTALLQPPNGGLFGFNVIVPGEEPMPRRESSRPAEIAVVPAPTPVPIAQRFDPGSSPTATTVERTREVQLRVVTLNSQGQPEDSDEFIPLDEGELNNLPELFQSLPDNRYRIYLRTENGSRRLIRDVVIRNRKVVELDESAGTVELEPAEETRPQEPIPDNPPAAETELNRASRREIRFEAPQSQELPPLEGRTPALTAALVSASSLVGGLPLGPATDWRQRARRALLASVTRTSVRRDNEDQCH